MVLDPDWRLALSPLLHRPRSAETVYALKRYMKSKKLLTTFENDEPVTKWCKLSEKTPLNNEEALVRSNGIVYLAKYNAQRRKFILKNGSHIENKASQILWQTFGN